MSSASFTTLPPSAPDPIYTISELAKTAGPGAIDGTIGVYMDEDSKTAMFPSVRKAIGDMGAAILERSYGYPPLLGLPGFRSAVTDLLFGDGTLPVASVAAVGGTGAVSLCLRMAKLMNEGVTVLLPVPAYANHQRLCAVAGLRTIGVPYFLHGEPTVEGIEHALRHTHGPKAVLLQAGCHNPTGKDFTRTQWEEIAALCTQHGAVAILDLAYQGFGGTPEEDAWTARLFAQSGATTLIAWSASKNHCIYGERVGLACAVTADDAMKTEVERHWMLLTRGVHSAAATFGQSIVMRVQSTYRDEWLHDLAQAREMLGRKRVTLHANLPEGMRKSTEGHGMFAMLPLTPEQIDALKNDHNVFLTGDGRLNIAGIPLKRVPELADRIRTVS